MTDSIDKTDKEIETLTARFGRAVRRSRAVLFLERAVPRALPPLYTTGIFLSASWAGLWLPLPPAARMAGVAAFAAAFLASPFLAKTKSLLVSKDDALKRLDSNAGDPTRPAQTLGDKPSSGSPQGKELWNLHLARIWDKWDGKFEAGRPNFGIAARDPYYFRFAVPLAMMATLALAGGDRVNRVTEAFNWSARPAPTGPVTPVTPLQVKAWVTPPENIDAPPLYLTEATRDTQGGNKLVAHENSLMTILVYGSMNKVLVNGEEIAVKKVIAPKGLNGEPAYQYEIPLTVESTIIEIQNGPKWNFTVTQDQAPIVTLDKVAPNDKNIRSLDITCAAKDDYGVREGEVVIRIPGGQAPGATPLPSGKLPPVVLPAPCIRQ